MPVYPLSVLVSLSGTTPEMCPSPIAIACFELLRPRQRRRRWRRRHHHHHHHHHDYYYYYYYCYCYYGYYYYYYYYAQVLTCSEALRLPTPCSYSFWGYRTGPSPSTSLLTSWLRAQAAWPDHLVFPLDLSKDYFSLRGLCFQFLVLIS